MGFPKTGVVSIPRNDTYLFSVVSSAMSDPMNIKEELISGCLGGWARPGHLTANTWVVNFEMTKILFVKHPKLSWTSPGGHVDPGEKPVNTALRELKEETGLDGELFFNKPVSVVGTMIPAESTQSAYMHYCLSYLVGVDSKAKLITEKGQPAQWFSLDEEIPEGNYKDNYMIHNILKLVKR